MLEKRESEIAAMKLIAIIFLVYFSISADAGKGGSKFCKSADMKLDELKDMIEDKECPSPGDENSVFKYFGCVFVCCKNFQFLCSLLMYVITTV